METLPDNDKDLQLARKINELRTTGEPLTDLQDPLVDELLAYKHFITSETKHHDVAKNDVWDTIKTQTKQHSKSSSKIFSLENRKMLAAAVVLIAAFLSFVYYQFYDAQKLVLKSGSKIQTVQLSDGTEITLRPYSSLYRIQDGETEDIFRLKGEGFFDVTTNPNRTFSVKTNRGSVTVLGTRFNVSTWSEQTQVFLEEGSVKVTALKQNRSVVLKPGESASIDDKTNSPKVAVSSIAEFTDWLDEQLIFENKPAHLIIHELEHHFNISIELPEEVSQQALSGRLSLQNLDTSLGDLGMVLDGTFRKTEDNTFTFEAN